MAFCTKCGSKIPEDAVFCPHCGITIEKQKPIQTPLPPPSSTIIERMIRAARLDATLYDEVEMDETATLQALFVVVIASACSGIGSAISIAMLEVAPSIILVSLISGLILSLVGWLIWSFITYFIGTKVFGGNATYGELLRTIGFSDAPGILLIFSFIPLLGGVISFIIGVWGLIAMAIAVRQALDFSTTNAILTCIVGFIAYIVFEFILFFLI
jgi:hypothetical protein